MSLPTCRSSLSASAAMLHSVPGAESDAPDALPSKVVAMLFLPSTSAMIGPAGRRPVHLDILVVSGAILYKFRSIRLSASKDTINKGRYLFRFLHTFIIKA